MPVSIDRTKKFLSSPSLWASFWASSRTNLAGLFYPTPPSTKEELCPNKFDISAEGKKVGAADVALAQSFA